LEGGPERYGAVPLIAALSPVHCYITRFHLWSPIVSGIHLVRQKVIPNVAQTLDTDKVLNPNSGLS